MPRERLIGEGGMKRGLLLLTDDFGGGTGNHLLQMMERWDLRRWRPEIVTEAPRTARVASPVPVTRLPAEAVKVYPLAQLLRLRRIRGVVRDRRPEIVHAYFFWSILYARLLKMAGLIPRLVENREDMGFGWGWHEYAWLRMTRSAPDVVICVSAAVRATAVERERLDAERTAVIRNGVPNAPPVDAGRVRRLRRRYELPEDAPVVGMVANLNRSVKGGELFLRVVARVVRQVPEVRFLVVGLGGLEDRLQDEARRSGVGSCIRFTGYTDDVAAHYELMDVSILTSWTEGLSITLLESMSHGLPVVATHVGGNPEVVVDGETGRLAPAGDAGALASHVVELLRDPDLRAQMGASGRRRARSEFDLGHVAREYEAVYDGLLPGAGALDDDGDVARRSTGKSTAGP